jgi:hypothetical protein
MPKKRRSEAQPRKGAKDSKGKKIWLAEHAEWERDFNSETRQIRERGANLTAKNAKIA